MRFALTRCPNNPHVADIELGECFHRLHGGDGMYRKGDKPLPPVVRELLDIPGIAHITIEGGQHRCLGLTKNPPAHWDDLWPAILETLRGYFDAPRTVRSLEAALAGA